MARRTGAARTLILLWVLLTQSGCLMARFLGQATYGQLSLFEGQRSIDAVLADPETPPRTRRLLSEIPALRVFGAKHGLATAKSYRTYVELGRGAVVWVVTACRPLSLEPRTWTFPFVGGFAYLGWFEPSEAHAFAQKLSAEGWDVSVRGSVAYSTLGVLNDPVLSSMLRPGDDAVGDLANVLLHEWVHATLHIRDQSYFNESLASFVADRMTPVYLTEHYGDSSPLLLVWEADQAAFRRDQSARARTYKALETLYASKATDQVKLARKAVLLAELQVELDLLERPTNATLLGYRTYGAGLAELESLWQSVGRDWKRFFEKLRALGPNDFPDPMLEEFGSVLGRLE